MPIVEIHDRYSFSSSHTTGAQNFKDMCQDFEDGKPVYVCFKDPKRAGAIGKVLELNCKDNYGRPSTTGSMTIGWDGRQNKVFEMSWQVSWYKDYTGPTVYAYNKDANKKPEDLPVFKENDKGEKVEVFPEVFDKLGRKIEPGQLCTYVCVYFGASTELRIGHVVRIDRKGHVWCKNLPIFGDDHVTEKRVKYSDTIIILTDDLMDQLVLARLQGNNGGK